MKHKKRLRRIRLIWHFGRKYILVFFIAEICILVSYAISVLLPLNLSELIDKVLYGRQYFLFHEIVSNYIKMFLIATVFNFIYLYAWQYLNNHYVLNIKNKIFEKTITAKASFLSSMNSGDVMTRIDNDSDQFIHAVQRNLFHFINSALMCVGIIALVWRINRTIALMLVAAAAVPIVFTRVCGKFTEKYSKRAREVSGNMTGRLYEIIKGFHNIKLFEAYKWAEVQLLSPLKRLISLGNAIRRTDFFVNKGTYLINLSISLIIYSFSIDLIVNGALTVGMFLAIIEYIALLHKKFNWMLRIYLAWFGRRVSIDRVNEVLDQESERTTGCNVDEITFVNFEDVAFSYGNQNLVLKDMTFHISKGEKVAIVGRNGSGKSTTISLLLGLYKADAGKVLINHTPIEDINLSSLRQRIGVVSQEIALFEDSVRYNLCLGQCYSDLEIEKALIAVDLLDVIENLPDGIDTVIGSSSYNFSNGQKQRLMIARLLLKKPQFIIMDEGTSALDVETERNITQYLQKFFETTTMLIVSHRLETIKNCDRILVLNGHAIECSGNHQQLLEESLTYCSLFGGEKNETSDTGIEKN